MTTARVLEVTSKAVVPARADGEALRQIRTASTRGGALADLGRLSEAVDVFEDGLRATDDLPEESAMLLLQSNLAFALARLAMQDRDQQRPEAAWRPRAERAIKLLQHPMRTSRERGDLGAISGLTDNLALAYVALGELAKAHEVLDDDEALRRPHWRPRSMEFFHCVRARAHLQANKPKLALATLERARVTADVRGATVNMDEIHRLTSLAYEASGDTAQALESYKLYHELREHIALDRVERVHLEARHDSLTGLANRRRFDEYLAGTLPRASADRPVSLVLLDIDHFKAINDRHTHLAGDAALCWVANHMRAHCRQTDLPARLGGDEFALVLGAPRHVARQVCDRLRAAVAGHAKELPPDVTVRLSAGIVEATAPCDPLALFKRADQALYAAKAAGRDGVCLD